jgi:hypothetical protein
MLLPILLTGLLSQTPCSPPDSSAIPMKRSGGGITLGLQSSIVDPKPFQLGSGIVAGYYRYYKVNRQWSLQVEFQTKIATGYNIYTHFEDNVVNPQGLSTSRRTFYVRSLVLFEMPVVLQYRPQPASRQIFFGGLRPSINVTTKPVNGNNSISVSNGVFPSDFSALSVRKAVRRFDLGLTLGWSYAFSTHLSLDLRYTQGFVDLTADNFFKTKDNTLNSDFQVSFRTNL